MKFDFYGCRETSKEYSYIDTGYSKEHKFGYGYNGEALDDTGLIYLRARYYNPRIGQFIQLDTYQGEQDSIESQNRYAYTMNNPYKYVDKGGNKAAKLKVNPSRLISKVVNKNTNKTKPIVSTLTGKTISGTVVNYLKEKQEEREKERIRQQFINAGIPADHPDLNFGVDLAYSIKKLCTLLIKPIKAQKEREQQLWLQNQKAQEWYNNSLFTSISRGALKFFATLPDQFQAMSDFAEERDNNLPRMIVDQLKETAGGVELLIECDFDLDKFAKATGFRDGNELIGYGIGGILATVLTKKLTNIITSTTTGGGFSAGDLTSKVKLNKKLLRELAKSGVKYNADDVVMITKNSSGKLVWLENGSESAGLKHIIKEHGRDFINKGILEDKIPDYIASAIEKGKIVGYQGRGTGRPIYEFMYNGTIQRVAITIGDNGFIVGANPVSIK